MTVSEQSEVGMGMLEFIRNALVPTIGPRPKHLETRRLLYKKALKQLQEVTEAIGDGTIDSVRFTNLDGIGESIDEADELMREALTGTPDGTTTTDTRTRRNTGST